MFEVQDKIIAITGAGGVLCGTMAKHLAKAGAKIAVLDLNSRELLVLSAGRQDESHSFAPNSD